MTTREELVKIVEEANDLAEAHNYEYDAGLYDYPVDTEDCLLDVTDHCTKNVLVAVDLDIDLALYLINKLEKAYEVSGFGESIIIGYLNGNYDSMQMERLLD